MLREDYKFLEDFRGKGNLQYGQRNNEKLEDCANNNWYDTKTKKDSLSLVGFSRLLNPAKHEILTNWFVTIK